MDICEMPSIYVSQQKRIQNYTGFPRCNSQNYTGFPRCNSQNFTGSPRCNSQNL